MYNHMNIPSNCTSKSVARSTVRACVCVLFHNLSITYEMRLHTVTKVCGDMFYGYFLQL